MFNLPGIKVGQVGIKGGMGMNLRNIVSGVSSLPQVQEFLKKIQYPIGKQTLIDKASGMGANDTIMSVLQKLPDKQYQSQSEVEDELGKVIK